MKYEVFNTELNYIKNENLRESAILILKALPDYFYEVPASSTGKYHPAFSLGSGGLVRHTKVAIRIAIELFNDSAICKFDDHEKDLLIISIMMHDGLKSGFEKSEYTKFEHPILVGEFIENKFEEFKLLKKDSLFIGMCIKSHMGPWNTNNYSSVVLPIPENKYQRFMHMCDYLSSRRFLDVKFNGMEIE